MYQRASAVLLIDRNVTQQRIELGHRVFAPHFVFQVRNSVSRAGFPSVHRLCNGLEDHIRVVLPGAFVIWPAPFEIGFAPPHAGCNIALFRANRTRVDRSRAHIGVSKPALDEVERHAGLDCSNGKAMAKTLGRRMFSMQISVFHDCANMTIGSHAGPRPNAGIAGNRGHSEPLLNVLKKHRRQRNLAVYSPPSLLEAFHDNNTRIEIEAAFR